MIPPRNFPPVSLLVPHKPPMQLLDAVTSADEKSITCTATVAADSPFVVDGHADVLLCIELVAQTVAAYIGLQRFEKGLPPQVGFLVSCREATFHVDQLSAGDTLQVSARHVWGDAALGSFRGHVDRDKVRITSVELGVFRGTLESYGVSP